MVRILPTPQDPLQDGKSLVELVQHMGSDEMIVRAARVSFANDKRPFEPESDAKLIRYLINNQHSSPLEHCYVTFHISCPLFVKYQWTRHRTWPYWNLNEVSRRYTSEDIEVWIPKELRGQAVKNRQASEGVANNQARLLSAYREGVQDAVYIYNYLIDQGVAREQARAVLPEALYTRFYATANLHNIFHYHKLRDDEHAQPEIREYARCIGHITEELFPLAWLAYKEMV